MTDTDYWSKCIKWMERSDASVRIYHLKPQRTISNLPFGSNSTLDPYSYELYELSALFEVESLPTVTHSLAGAR